MVGSASASCDASDPTRCHRSSVSTSSPGTSAEPSSSPCSSARSSSEPAARAQARTHASCRSLPGSASFACDQRRRRPRDPAARRGGRGSPYASMAARRLSQQPLERADVALGRRVAEDHVHVPAGRQLGVAHHVPRGRPAERAGERVADRRHPLPQRAPSSARPAGSSSTSGRRRSPASARERPRRPAPGCRPAFGTSTSTRVRRSRCPSTSSYSPIASRCDRRSGQSAGADCSMRNDAERRRVASRRLLEHGPQRVEPGRLQPLGAPRAEVAARRLLERRQEVGERRCSPTRGGGSRRAARR